MSTYRAEETWEIEGLHEVTILDVKPRNGDTERHKACRIVKNNTFVGTIDLSSHTLNRLARNEAVLVNGKHFYEPHPWEGRWLTFLPVT